MQILKQAKQISLTGNTEFVISPVSDININTIPISELKDLHKIMMGPHVVLALMALESSGFLNLIIPEIKQAIELKTSNLQFKKIWPHTLQVINQTPQNLLLRWAALFHDLGKVKTFFIKNGKVTFHGHEHVSANIFNDFTKKIPIFNTYQKNTIYFLIYNLDRVENYKNDWSDSGVRRFYYEMGDNLNLLIYLSKADITTGNPKNKTKILNRIANLEQRILSLQDSEFNKPILPKGIGTKISEEFNIPLGSKLGEIKKLLETNISNKIISNKESIDYYILWLKNNWKEN